MALGTAQRHGTCGEKNFGHIQQSHLQGQRQLSANTTAAPNSFANIMRCPASLIYVRVGLGVGAGLVTRVTVQTRGFGARAHIFGI